MAEAGVEGYNVNGWFGLFGRAGTDPQIIETLNAAVLKMLDDPKIRTQLNALGAVPAGTPPAEFAAFVQQEHDMWAEVIERAGITIDQ